MVRFNGYMPNALRYTLRRIVPEEPNSANQIVLKPIQDYVGKRLKKGGT